MNKFIPKQQSEGVPVLIPSPKPPLPLLSYEHQLQQTTTKINMWWNPAMNHGWLTDFYYAKEKKNNKFLKSRKQLFFPRSLKSKSFWKKFLGRPQYDG